MWVSGYDVETKMHSSQWMEKGSPRPKKARMSRSEITVMVVCVCFFYWKGVVHHEFVPRVQMVNKQLYQEVLAPLRDAVRMKRHELWENQTWMLHHDNAPAPASLIRSSLAKHQTSVVPHPTYPPDLASADFFLFPRLKPTLKERRFRTIEEIQ